MAAEWEYEENGNIASARSLMQRALRVNSESKVLWIEYFKLELLWVKKLQDRRKVLFGEGLDETTQAGIDLPELDAEKSQETDFIALPSVCNY